MTQYRWNFEDDMIRPIDEERPLDLFSPKVEQFGLKGWKRIASNHFVQAYTRDHRMLLIADADDGQQARDYMLSYVQYCIRNASGNEHH